jgi:hypothetical protein
MHQTLLPRNEGTIDRAMRALVGGGLLALSAGLLVSSSRTLGVGTGLLGVTLLVTSVTGSCQLYRPFGVSTLK